MAASRTISGYPCPSAGGYSDTHTAYSDSVGCLMDSDLLYSACSCGCISDMIGSFFQSTISPTLLTLHNNNSRCIASNLFHHIIFVCRYSVARGLWNHRHLTKAEHGSNLSTCQICVRVNASHRGGNGHPHWNETGPPPSDPTPLQSDI